MATNISVSDITTRARTLLNDTFGNIWTDSALIPHVNSAYRWLFNSISTIVDVDFEVVTSPDITYTAGTPGTEQSLGPADAGKALSTIVDLWVPISIEFRLTQSEEWQPIDRRDRLPSRVTQQIDRLWEWEWRGRNVYVISATNGGFLRVRYQKMLPVLGLATDPILFDNGLEALAYYAAAQAFESRGQVQMAAVKMGKPEPPTGALGYREQILQRLTLIDQEVGRRGSRFTQTGIDVVTTRFSG